MTVIILIFKIIIISFVAVMWFSIFYILLEGYQDEKQLKKEREEEFIKIKQILTTPPPKNFN